MDNKNLPEKLLKQEKQDPLLCVLNLCKNKIDIDVPKNLDINQKMEKCCVSENSYV